MKPDLNIENQEKELELISTKEIVNEINNISKKKIEESDLVGLLETMGINIDSIVEVSELKEIYEKIENPNLEGVNNDYFIVSSLNEENTDAINEIFKTEYTVSQFQRAGGRPILFDGDEIKVNKKNLIKFTAFKIKHLIDEKNN